MEFLTKAISLIMSLSILVVLHELGHFIPARLFKTRVEKFYLFFDWKFSLFKKKIGDTTYGIGWLPLGGYVKISGMIDESMDKDQMAKPPEPWEFRSKPAWQRLIIMIGGVTVNVLLAWVIYSMILFAWGKDVLPTTSAVNGVQMSQVMKDHGFKDGDILKKVDGETPYLLNEFKSKILLDDAKTVEVERNGKDTIINIKETLIADILSGGKGMYSPLVGFVVESVSEDSPNFGGDLKKGDEIVGVNGKSVPYFQFFGKEIAEHKCEKVNLNVIRGGDSIEVVVKVTGEGKIGVRNINPENFLSIEKRRYTFTEAIPAGFNEVVSTLDGYVKQFKLVFTPEGAQGLGGFGALGGLFPDSFSDENYWQSFWEITALLSIILAFMNLLPIPALDGGHVMFLIYEMVRGKKPGDKFMERAQVVGMVLLLSLMVFANGNDLFKKFFGGDDAPVVENCWQEPTK